MKRMLALAAAMALIAPLFWPSSAYAGDKKKKDKPGKDAPAQQQPQTPQNPPGIIDVGPPVAVEEVVKKLEKGKTTMSDALALLGQPQVPAMPNGLNGGLTLMYHWRKQLAGPYVPGKGVNIALAFGGIGLPIGKGAIKKANEQAFAQAAAIQDSFKSLTLMFDEQGKLKQWISHPLILPKEPPKDTTAEKDKKAEALPAESLPLAAVTKPQ